MDAVSITEHLLRNCMVSQRKLSERWSVASHKLARVSPDFFSFTVEFQQISRLEALIVELEEGLARRIESQQGDEMLFSFQFLVTLCRSWVSLNYEALRSMKQRMMAQATTRTIWEQSFAPTFTRLEMLRVTELKKELAKGGKLMKEGRKVEMYLPEKPEETSIPYVHGQTILNSLMEIRPTDGSLVWKVFNVSTGAMDEMYRRDLSDEILRAFERLDL